MKKITISSCKECPFVDHAGGFGHIAYIPTCTKGKSRKLPYTEHATRGMVTACGTGVIPKWCPLEDDKLENK